MIFATGQVFNQDSPSMALSLAAVAVNVVLTLFLWQITRRDHARDGSLRGW
ncbi:MAG: hypothetical protein K8R99_06610 [Actinomycetia bacterium]|nr:hypothetical protein [Actinomycetes bacterium]